MVDHDQKRLPPSGGVEQDFLTKFRRYIFSDKGRARRVKRAHNRRFRRKIRVSLAQQRPPCEHCDMSWGCRDCEWARFAPWWAVLDE